VQYDNNSVNYAVCTLFEGDYSKGFAVLVNSLIRHGFTGTVFAGFRGSLPQWAVRSGSAKSAAGKSLSISVAEGVQICLLPLETTSHLTNYKPQFMLSLWKDKAKDYDGLLYLDPDIVIARRWSYIAQWLQCGVALCEDVNSPVHDTHPRRRGWQLFYGARGFEFTSVGGSYVNGGAVGTRSQDVAFVELWQKLTLLMGELIGGLETTRVKGGKAFADKGFADCFDIADQDSLNAAVQCYRGEISILGQEAMGIRPGDAVLLHALGGRKPWRCSYLLDALRGYPPTCVDKTYWSCAAVPLRTHSYFKIWWTNIAIRLCSMVGRFYRRV
jgi:hypothetical protein